MTVFIKKILFPTLLFISAFLIILYFVSGNSQQPTNYTLKSYKNTIALYNGQEIVSVYENIVLNTLPEQDIKQFNMGISFSSLPQVEDFLEDYE